MGQFDQDNKDVDSIEKDSSVELESSESNSCDTSQADVINNLSDRNDLSVQEGVVVDEQVKEEVEAELQGNIDSKDFSSVYMRAKGVMALITVLFVFVLFSIISLQFCARGEKLRKMGRSNNFIIEKNVAKRGDLVSEKGTVFATTQEKYKAFMDMRSSHLPSELFYGSYAQLADSMASLFKDASAATYKARLDKWYKTGNGYQLVSPRGHLMDYLELQRFRKFPIVCGRSSFYKKDKNGKLVANTEKRTYGGVSIEKQYVRVNLLGSMAQRTLGRQESEFQTGYGLEKSFDKYLRGTDGTQMKRRISGVFWMPVESANNVKPVEGANVVVTIDADIQDVAERSLRDILENYKATWGTAVVMEVKTGAVRAMVNLGWNDGRVVEDYNHAIGDNVEPGSTFKLLPLIALLDDAGMDINDKVDTKQGRDVINGIPVNDTHGYGVLTLEGVMEKSSNIGFARAIDTYYRKTPSKYIESIFSTGLCDSVPLQLEGSRKPYIKRPTDKSWSNADLVTMSYGYAIQVTALRTLILYNAIANDGKMISPILVKRVEKDGRVLEEFDSQVIKNRVCSPSTLKIVRRTLEKVVTDGTGEAVFRDENYIIAGKTGTSKQVAPNGRYEDDKGVYYLASFVGYFPANDPQYSCVVYVKTMKPHGVARPYYGASLAAPVFRDISHYIYSMAMDWGSDAKKYANQLERQLAGEREKNNKKQWTYTKSRAYRALSDGDLKYLDMPVSVKRGNNSRLSDALGELDIKRDKVECGTLKGMTEVLSSSVGIEDADNVMPNVVGMGLNDAITLLEKRGLVVEVSGKGTVRSQTIKAGQDIKVGNIVRIRLSLN